MFCEYCKKREATETHHVDGDHDNDDPSNLMRVCKPCHEELEDRQAKLSELRFVYKEYKDTVEDRKVVASRYRSLHQYDEFEFEHLKNTENELREAEKKLKKRIKTLVVEHDIYNWLEAVYGIGAINAAGLISTIHDIYLFDTVSELWSYMGLRSPTSFDSDKDYQRYRMATKDKKTMVVYDIGERFIREDSYYRQFYDERREKTESDGRFGEPEENKGHYYNDARRYAAKLFLSHLWEVWRKMEGYETPDPYILTQKNHIHKVHPPHLEVVGVGT